jgi:hypothetical protein
MVGLRERLRDNRLDLLTSGGTAGASAILSLSPR